MKKCFLALILLMTSLLPSNASASDELFTLDNVSAQYLKKTSNKITILEYYDKNSPKISFAKDFQGYKCTINKIKCMPSMVYSLMLDSSHTSKKFNIEFVKGKNKKATVVQLLPDDFSSYEVVGKSKLETNILFSRTLLDHAQNMRPVSELFSLKPDGQIFFYRRLPFSAVDFRPHNLDGKMYYSYLRAEVSFSGISIIGERELLDDKMIFVKTFPDLFDMHEFILLDLDWYIGTRYTPAQTSLDVNYINQELVEIKNGKEIYSWSTDELAKQSFISVGPIKTQFYGKNVVHQYHLNGLQILPQNEWLVSLGYDGIIIIDKPTKKVKMIFAGANDQFSLPPEQSLVFLHTPFFDIKNQTLTVFHNDLNSKPFKIFEYTIDRNAKKVNNFSIISTPTKIISQSMGSVEKNGNIYSISTGYTTKVMPNFIEQTDKTANMQLTFKNPNGFTYRIYRELSL